jgi:ATP-dependent Clp protease protease subunit
MNEFQNYAKKHMGISSLNLQRYENSIRNNYISPMIIEERQLNVAQMSVFDRLMMDRVIFLGTGIDDYVSNVIQAQLLFLESVDKEKDIQIYINSGGGIVSSGLAIYDTMQYVAPDVATICTGMSASMAAVLLCAGSKGKRTALKHSRIMIHQPSGGAEGQASDILIVAKEIQMLKDELYNIISEHTGKAFEQVEKDSDRDYWMTSEEAKIYGMIDEVLYRHKNENEKK